MFASDIILISDRWNSLHPFYFVLGIFIFIVMVIIGIWIIAMFMGGIGDSNGMKFDTDIFGFENRRIIREYKKKYHKR